MAVVKQATGLRDDLSKALASKVSCQACPCPGSAGGLALAWLLLPLEPASTFSLVPIPHPDCPAESQEYGQAAEVVRQIVTLDGLDLAVLKVSHC